MLVTLAYGQIQTKENEKYGKNEKAWEQYSFIIIIMLIMMKGGIDFTDTMSDGRLLCIIPNVAYV